MIGSEVENSTSVLASDPLLLQAESVDDAQLLPSVSATYPYRDETGTRTISRDDFERIRSGLRQVLSKEIAVISAQIAGGREGHEREELIRKEEGFRSRVAEVIGGKRFPPV